MKRPLLSLALTLSLAAGAAAQSPIGTAFTYQGQLNVSGQPANASYDLQFKLFDAALGGTQIGSTISASNIAVTRGLFTQPLDFGAATQNNNARWLEISVKPAGQAIAYTSLAPRQALTAAPYALGLALPFAGAQVQSSTLFSIDNNGTGGAISATANGGTALYASTSGGNAVFGYSLGTTGSGGFFRTENLTNPAAALRAESNGTGPALSATSTRSHAGEFTVSSSANTGSSLFASNSSSGPAAEFSTISATSTSSTVQSTNSALGHAGFFSIDNAGNHAAALMGQSVGDGAAVSGVSTGLGSAGVFWQAAAGSNTDAVHIANAGGGAALSITNTNPVGSGLTIDTASNTVAALNIVQGTFRCQGAGLSTNTFAFIRAQTDAELGGGTAMIDHPMCNGRQDALVFITPQLSVYAGGQTTADPVAAFYNSGHWYITAQDGSFNGYRHAWNVMVILP